MASALPCGLVDGSRCGCELLTDLFVLWHEILSSQSYGPNCRRLAKHGELGNPVNNRQLVYCELLKMKMKPVEF